MTEWQRTERGAVFRILNQNGDGLDNLDFDFVASVLLNNSDNVVEHVFFQEEPTPHEIHLLSTQFHTQSIPHSSSLHGS